MFGVKLHQRRDLVEGLARALILSGQNLIGHQDQASLDRILWPVAKYDVVGTPFWTKIEKYRFFCSYVICLTNACICDGANVTDGPRLLSL